MPNSEIGIFQQAKLNFLPALSSAILLFVWQEQVVAASTEAAGPLEIPPYHRRIVRFFVLQRMLIRFGLLRDLGPGILLWEFLLFMEKKLYRAGRKGRRSRADHLVPRSR